MKTRRNKPRRKPRKIKIKTQKQTGGMIDPRSIFVFGTMLMYGLASVFIGPAYLIAEMLNAPITSINNFSRKAFNDSKTKWIHRPLLDLAFLNSEKPIDEKDFWLEEDMHIHQNVAVVSLDKHPNDEAGNMKHAPSKVDQYAPSSYDSLLNMFGRLNENKKLKLLVFQLFDYIENLRATDKQRQKDIKRIIYAIEDYKVLVKFYLIYKTLKQTKCPAIQTVEKTILKGADVVTVVNPFYNPCNISYTKRLECVKRHITQKRFDPNDPDDKVCRVSCDTCTFRNSVGQLTKKYITSGAWYGAISILVSGAAMLPEVLGMTGPMMAAFYSGVDAAIAALGMGSGMGMVFAGSGAIIGFLIVVTGTNDAGNIFRNVAWLAMLPPEYTAVVKQMLDTYFRTVRIKNPEVLQKTDEEFAKDYPKKISDVFKVFITRKEIIERNIGQVSTNILPILDAIQVESNVAGTIDESEELVLKKFNWFMCKYDVHSMIGWRIAQLYSDKEKKYTTTQLLDFILNDSMK
jgi:hypothetical protein